jgi:sigma-E factor negative regulatory protein RseC
MGKGQIKIIEHEGIVKTLEDDSIIVAISATSACSGCHAQGVCGISGSQEKLIKIDGKYDVKPGNSVIVSMKLTTGYRALLLGYVLPLTIVIVVLCVLSSLHLSELASGLFSLGAIIPYYIILIIFRKKINKKFSFNINV